MKYSIKLFINSAFYLKFNLAAEILPSPDGILLEDVTNGTVLNIVKVRINSSLNDDSVEDFQTSVYKSFSQNNKSEPVYVNSDVNNSFLKVSVKKVNSSENGIRVSIEVSWNILKDDRETEDWIGYYIIGLYLYLILLGRCSYYEVSGF